MRKFLVFGLLLASQALALDWQECWGGGGVVGGLLPGFRGLGVQGLGFRV